MKFSISHLLGLLLVAFAITAVSCNDIFEKNIEDDRVQLVAPQNGTTSQSFTIVFWWDELDGADEYNLEVASPDFVQPDLLVLDTTVSTTTFTWTLTSGAYNWRVKGINGGYETDWSTFQLTVDSTEDISGSFVNAIQPADGFATQDGNVLFQWQLLENADEYELDWESEAGASGTETTSADSITISLAEGIYDWSVTGRNSSYVSQRQFHRLYVDATTPDAPTLTSPANGDSLTSNQNIAFDWTRNESVTYAPLNDVLYIYTDTTNFTILDSTLTSAAGLTRDSLSTGEYWWAVQTFDEAGNRGPFSEARRLLVP